MKKFLFIITICCLTFLYANDWEINTNGLLMAEITGYEDSERGRHEIRQKEYYDEMGNVLLRISFSVRENKEYRWELFKYNSEGKEIERSTYWDDIRTGEIRRSGYMKTDYVTEDDGYSEIVSGDSFLRIHRFNSEGHRQTLNNFVFDTDKQDGYSWNGHYVNELLSDGSIREIEYHDEKINRIIDSKYDLNGNMIYEAYLSRDLMINHEDHYKYDEDGNIKELEIILYHPGEYSKMKMIDGVPVVSETVYDDSLAGTINYHEIRKYNYNENGRLISMTKTRNDEFEDFYQYSYFKQDESGIYNGVE